MVKRDNPMIDGPWLSNEALSRLPKVSREFQLNRDPTIRAQTLDLHKSESQRRGESDGGSAKMVRQDKPQRELKPPAQMRRDVDAAQFNGRWLAAQREAAMRKAKPLSRTNGSPDNSAPKRGRTPEP